MRKTSFLAAGLAVLLAGPAFAAGNNCLRIGQIYNWNAKDNSTLIVEDNSHHKFTVNLLGACTGLRFKERIGFKSPGGSSLSCVSSGDTVFFHDNAMGRQRCAVKTVTAYTPEMEKADKAAKAAKEAPAPKPQ